MKSCLTCGFDQAPEGATFCPRCASLILRPLPIDYSRHVAERTVDFSGREWVFRAIDGWLGDPEAARILLLTGEPGCGKTAIAARLVQFSLDAATPPDGVTRLTPGFLSARHFCSGDHRWISPHRFSEAVSHQLGRYPEFSEALVESLRPRAGEGKAPAQVIHQQIQHVSDQGVVIGSINIIERIEVGDDVRPEDAFMRLVLEPLQALSPQEEGHKVVILVDALDEAVAYSGKANIVSLLAGARDLPEGVHFLLTCRNDSSLIGRFPGTDRLRINISSEEHTDKTEGDIRAYLERRISEPEIARRAAAAGPGEVLRKELIGKAAGNFLYVRFLLDEVAEGQRTLEDLEGLPRGLYGLYRTFLDRLNPEMKEGRSSDAWRENYQPLLGCLSVAKEPVPAGLVADWLGRSEGEVLALLNTELAQLRETDNGTDYRLYHRSMAEFLAASIYRENGATVPNLYYTPPYEGHGRIIRYYLDEFTDAWDDSDAYGLRYLPIHMVEAGQNDRLRELLLDFGWLRAKLAGTDVTTLIADYDLLPADGDARRVGGALRLSAHVLAGDKAQLWSQLYGRLMGEESPAIQAMLAEWPEEPWLRPLRPSLAAPGGPLLRTLQGHSSRVHAVAVYDGGRRAISASADHTLKVWDLRAGVCLHTFSGEGAFWTCAVTPDGRTVVAGDQGGQVHILRLEGVQ